MNQESIKASPEHEKKFRTVYALRDDLKDDPYWKAAYEHAATNKLYPDEMAAIGPALVHRPSSSAKGKL